MKAQVSSTLVYVILFSIVALVMIISLNRYTTLFESTGEKAACEWSVFLSGGTKILGVETIPIKCKADRITLAKEDLVKNYPKANNAIKLMRKRSPKLAVPMKHYVGTIDDRKKMQYLVDEKIALAMKSCWDKVLWGEMPIFNDWNGLLGVDSDKKAKWYQYHTIPPTTCIICSTITFSEELQSVVGKEPKNSLPEWMKLHMVPGDQDKRTYYQYNLDDLRKTETRQEIPYGVTEEQAVIYGRINKHKLRQWSELATDLTWWAWTGDYSSEKDHVDILTIIPYKDLKNVCHYAIG